MCHAKANGNYMNSMLALKEALDTGYDEALLLDANGFVMEGSGENIFLVRDGKLHTPDLTSALDGITRKTIMQLARESGSGENIFLVRDGKLHTPDLTSALDGITRKTIMQLARESGYEIVERRITRDEVYIADEAFFTGTAAEVTPIREIDGRQIGCGSRGPITEELQTKYFDVVYGRSEKHQDWLTYV
jgi:branched-chain amino acid aminotransferase